MSEPITAPYEFASLADYPVKDRILIRIADMAFYLLVRLIGSTVRFKIEGWPNFEAIAAAGKIPIYSFWHDRIFIGTYFWRKRKIVVMTSQSKDGEYIARFIQRLGYGAIRGSSTRGGSRALVDMIRTMRSGTPMGFALDGPKGPRYQAKPGAVILAKKTGNPLMPFVFESKRYWKTKSWDKLQIPRPFTQVLLTIDRPIYVPADATDEDVNAKLDELQRSLDGMVERGRRWREGE